MMSIFVCDEEQWATYVSFKTQMSLENPKKCQELFQVTFKDGPHHGTVFFIVSFVRAIMF